MGGVVFLPCWLLRLRRPSSGAYPGSLVGLMVDSGRAHAKEYFPELLLPVFLSSQWATDTPHLCRRPSNTSRLVWFSLLWGHCSIPWVLICTLLCVCPPRVESLFPPVLSKSCNQIPLTFKVWFSSNSSSHCWTPRLGSLTWGSEPSLQWVDSCGISVLQFVSHPPSSYGIWFYCDCAPPTISLWLLICLWMWGIFFVSSSVFLLMIVQQLVVIPVLSPEGVSACPSTLPSRTNFKCKSSYLFSEIAIFNPFPPKLHHCPSPWPFSLRTYFIEYIFSPLYIQSVPHSALSLKNNMCNIPIL